MKLSAWINTPGAGSKLVPPLDVENVQQLVIRDELGQPLVILIQQAPDRIWIAKQGDPDFDQALAYLGIPRQVMRIERTDAATDIRFPASTPS